MNAPSPLLGERSERISRAVGGEDRVTSRSRLTMAGEGRPALPLAGLFYRPERPASPCLGLPSDPGREERHDELRPDNACRDQDGRPLTRTGRQHASHQRKHRGTAKQMAARWARRLGHARTASRLDTDPKQLADGKTRPLLDGY